MTCSCMLPSGALNLPDRVSSLVHYSLSYNRGNTCHVGHSRREVLAIRQCMWKAINSYLLMRNSTQGVRDCISKDTKHNIDVEPRTRVPVSRRRVLSCALKLQHPMRLLRKPDHRATHPPLRVDCSHAQLIEAWDRG